MSKAVMLLWLVTYTPTPACIERDQKANTVQIVAGKKMDGKLILENVRRGTKPAPVERTEFIQTWAGGKKGKDIVKPTLVETDCYEVRMGLVDRTKMEIEYDPIKKAEELAAAETKRRAKFKAAAKKASEKVGKPAKKKG